MRAHTCTHMCVCTHAHVCTCVYVRACVCLYSCLSRTMHFHSPLNSFSCTDHAPLFLEGWHLKTPHIPLGQRSITIALMKRNRPNWEGPQREPGQAACLVPTTQKGRHTVLCVQQRPPPPPPPPHPTFTTGSHSQTPPAKYTTGTCNFKH